MENCRARTELNDKNIHHKNNLRHEIHFTLDKVKG